MGTAIFPYDYRASLFWQAPSAALLDQLRPDWLIVDPSLMSTEALKRVKEIPGILPLLTLHDRDGRERIIFTNFRVQTPGKLEKPGAVPDKAQGKLAIEKNHIETDRFGLATLPVKTDIEPRNIALRVFDGRKQLANIMDEPIVGIRKSGAGEYDLSFSMIQTGHWQVDFVDAKTGRPLNSGPVAVDVSDRMAITDIVD